MSPTMGIAARSMVGLAFTSSCVALQMSPRAAPGAHSSPEPPSSSISRRAALFNLFALPALASVPNAAFAAATGGGFTESQFATQGGGPPKLPPLAPLTKGDPSPAEIKRLEYGYQRLQYLIANWEKETTICIKGCKGAYESCGCVRDPVIVQSYMGYKSMEDPLFKAGDLMLRASVQVPDKDFDKYNEAMEKWNNKADSGNVMAYVSSWGEANPGGGQDNILRYLNKSKTEVQESAALLKTILDSLGVKV